MSEVEAPKKGISEKQRLANAANALKSTGPRTEQGKNICKWNRLEHGMRSTHDVLPGESQAEFDARMAAWMDHFDPETDVARTYVERAVRASWFVDRGLAAGDALAIKNMNALGRDAEEREADELEHLITQLADSPAATIRKLRKTLTGCWWIREQLLLLQEPVLDYRRLMPSQRTLAIHLLGKRVHDVFRDDPLVTRWVIALLGAQEGPGREDISGLLATLGGRPPGMSIEEFTFRTARLVELMVSPEGSMELLIGYFAEALAELDQHMEFLAEVAAKDQALNETIARLDLTGSGKQILNHVMAFTRSCDTALNRLDKLKDPPRPRRGPGGGGRPAVPPAPVADKQPLADDPALTATDVATEAPLAVAAGPVDLEPWVEPVTAADAAQNTIRPISEPEPSIEPDGAGNTIRPISEVEPSPAPDPAQNTIGPISESEPGFESELWDVESEIRREIQTFMEKKRLEQDRLNDVLDAEIRRGDLGQGFVSEADWERRFAAALTAAGFDIKPVRAPPGGGGPTG